MSAPDHDLNLVLDVAHQMEKPEPGAQAAPAGPFRGQLGNLVTWLRSHGITIAAILAKLPQILGALQGGDWMTIVQTLIGLFHLPPTTVPPAAPA